MDGPDNPETDAILQASRFWVQKVLVPILVCIGVSGNIITVIVLTRRRMRSSTNIYLSALAIADIIHLFFVFVLSFTHYSNIHDAKYALYWRFFGLSHWFCDAASTTSIWLIVSFTIERYIAVCHPIRGRVVCTERRAKSVIVIVYILCILTTASTKFEYQLSPSESCVQECKIEEKLGNSNNNNTTIHYIIAHHATIVYKTQSPSDVEFDLNNSYIDSQLKHILSSAIPQTLTKTKETVSNVNLIESRVNESKALTRDVSRVQEHIQENVLEKPPSQTDSVNTTLKSINETEIVEKENVTCCGNILTIDVEPTDLGKNETYKTIVYWYHAIFFWLLPLALIGTFNCILVRAVYSSQRIRRAMSNSQEGINMNNEKRITVMLIGLVVIFVICQTPTGLYLIYYKFFEPKTKRENNISRILGNFFNLLSIINSTCNFLLYCFFSKKFRSTFKKLLFERKRKIQDTIMLTSTKSRQSSQKFNPYKHGIMKRNVSEYHTPRNLETQSLTSIPRSKSLMARPVGRAKSSDLIV